MEYGPPDIFGRVVFCDDIRTEIDGKITLVGCYSADMVFPAPFPALLAKLGLYIQFFEKPDEVSEKLKLEIFFPGDSKDTPSMVSEIPQIEVLLPKEVSATRDADTRKVTSFNFVLSPVNITQEGYIRVQLSKGEDVYRIGRIKVSSKLNPIL